MNIRNGYLIPQMGLISLLNLTEIIQKRLDEELYELIHKQAAYLGTTIIDWFDLHPFYDFFPIEPFNDTKHQINFNQSIITELNTLLVEQSLVKSENEESCFSVSFTPHQNHIFCLVYSKNKAYIEIWESLAEVVPYFYWENDKRPEEVSLLDWEKRRCDWESLLNGSPEKSGYKRDFEITTFPLFLPKLMSYLPSFEKRFTSLSISIERYKRSKNNTYEESISLLNTPEGQRNIDETKIRIMDLMRMKFQPKDFTQPLSKR